MRNVKDVRRSAPRGLRIRGATRRRDLDQIALELADQRARDRAGHGDQPGFDVSLIVADDLVLHHLARRQIFEADRGAEDDAAAGIHSGRIDDLQRRYLALQFLDAALDEALAFTRGVVLRVFGQVAFFARLLDRLDGQRPIDAS